MRILVVEDNEDNLGLLKKILGHYGHDVIGAANGALAVALVAEERPDLVLMDLQMPEMDGWEATRRLREMPGLASLPIIALTAHALRPEDRQRAVDAGCTDYVTKPFNRQELLEKIRLYGSGRFVSPG